MKIEEVRKILGEYSEDQLRMIIAEMYKAIPKTIKGNKNTDNIIKDIEIYKKSKRKKTVKQLPDIKILKNEVNQFVKNARNQYYLVPNRYISKAERSKWRFKVKWLFKELILVSSLDDNLQESAFLLEKLYKVLCYSCDYVIFMAYDAFKSVGIEQKEFFRQILLLRYRYERKEDFTRNALILMMKNKLNRYTLYSDLLLVILDFLKTPDLKNVMINTSKMLIENEKNRKKRNKRYSRYELQKNVNILTEMVFLCYAGLNEFDEGISFFKENVREDDEEIAFYHLLKLLFRYRQTGYFLQEYKKAVKNGIKPRFNIKRLYKYVRETNTFPEYFE